MCTPHERLPLSVVAIIVRRYAHGNATPNGKRKGELAEDTSTAVFAWYPPAMRRDDHGPAELLVSNKHILR